MKNIFIYGVVIFLACVAVGVCFVVIGKYFVPQPHFNNSCPQPPKVCADGTKINLAVPNCNEVCPGEYK